MKSKYITKKTVLVFYSIVFFYFLVNIICNSANLAEPNIGIIYFDIVNICFSSVALIFTTYKMLSYFNKVNINVTKTDLVFWIVGMFLYHSFSSVFLSKLSMTVLIFSTLYSSLVFSLFGLVVALLSMCFFKFSKKKIYKNIQLNHLFIALVIILNITYSILMLCILNGMDLTFLHDISSKINEYVYNPFLIIKEIKNIIYNVAVILLFLGIEIFEKIKLIKEKQDRELTKKYLKNN